MKIKIVKYSLMCEGKVDLERRSLHPLNIYSLIRASSYRLNFKYNPTTSS
jgi:hypothetical protein